MIDLLLALHELAQERGEGMLPELADGLRKMQRLGEGRLIVIDGGAGEHRDETDVDATLANVNNRDSTKMPKHCGVNSSLT
jgi:hypothetical protein